MILIGAVDPGARECGVAVADVQTSAIQFAFLARNPSEETKGIDAWERMAHAVATELEERLEGRTLALLVIERQWIGFRPGKGGTKNPSQILNLAHVVGALAIRIPAARKIAILPSQWKGGSTKGAASKKRVNRATWAALKKGEKAVAEEAETYLGHNVKDSIGIVKWAVPRYRANHALGSLQLGFDDLAEDADDGED